MKSVLLHPGKHRSPAGPVTECSGRKRPPRAHSPVARRKNSELTSAPGSGPSASFSPSSTVHFTKMHGLGNDYIYVEEFESPVEDPSALAVLVSDRHFGVGSDGLVLIGPSRTADFSMRIFNADGSEAEMCGNATRCVGKYLFEKAFTSKREISLQTLAGIRRIFLEGEGAAVTRVRVDMGKPHLTPADLPMLSEGVSFINRDITVDGTVYRATAVSMGNPHLVVHVQGIDALDLPLLGPLFERHPLFPRGVNTEFVEMLGYNCIRMRVWERGSGETLACGTGACAALVACALSGFTDRNATVELPGGELSIEWDAEGIVHMTGDACFVCSGVYYRPRSR